MGHQAFIYADADDIRPHDEQPSAPVTHTTTNVPRQDVPRPHIRASNDVYKAAWTYTKVAMLFFGVILTTWIPSSANRMYSHIYPNEASKPLQFMSAAVLPLQGFWNAVIYTVTSWAACKALLEERGLWRSRTRLNEIKEQNNWKAGEVRDSRRVKIKNKMNSRCDDSESVRELAHPAKSDDGCSI